METTDRLGPRDRMLAGLGATARVCDIDGIRTSVLELGDGPPLVLLHGAIEVGGVIWTPVLASLAQRRRLVVPDLPGLGESSPVDRLDVERFGGWFAALLRETGVERPTLVAHSLGGSLATRAATRWGPLVGRLIVYGAPAVGPFRLPVRLRYLAVRFALRPTAANAERFDRFALYDLAATRQRDSAWFDAFIAYTVSQAAVPHVRKTMQRLSGTETKRIPDAELGRIQVPTALVWGRHDQMVPRRVGDIASARHGWPLSIVDDAAHVPHIEQPLSFVETLHSVEARLADQERR